MLECQRSSETTFEYYVWKHHFELFDSLRKSIARDIRENCRHDSALRAIKLRMPAIRGKGAGDVTLK